MFATADDLKRRWPGHPVLDEEFVAALLQDASDHLQTLYPTIPDQPTGLLERNLQRVVCAMARRSMEDVPDEIRYAESVSDTMGPFSTSTKFRDRDSTMYITGQERELIEAVLAEEAGPSGFVSVEMGGW